MYFRPKRASSRAPRERALRSACARFDRSGARPGPETRAGVRKVEERRHGGVAVGKTCATASANSLMIYLRNPLVLVTYSCRGGSFSFTQRRWAQRRFHVQASGGVPVQGVAGLDRQGKIPLARSSFATCSMRMPSLRISSAPSSSCVSVHRWWSATTSHRSLNTGEPEEPWSVSVRY